MAVVEERPHKKQNTLAEVTLLMAAINQDSVIMVDTPIPVGTTSSAILHSSKNVSFGTMA